ncbi:hypothetical protein ACGFZL_15410 [Streptomyces sp. NPDC048182]|uniref:hypothetical protein n=1 Tax=Streptomyces sp. NPDC048182 TaxID=3365507 RepID=UPI00371D27B6
MEQLLCLVCSAPTGRSKAGVLWRLPFPTSGHRWDSRPKGAMTTEPPVCLRHSAPPRSDVGYRAFFAAEAEIVGVHGTLHRPPRLLASPVEWTLRFSDPRMPWMVGTHFVRQLRQLTPVVEQGEEL